MKTIWKFKLMPISMLNLHKGAEFLHVDTQKGVPFVWYLVDPSQPTEVKVLKIFGTGFDIDDSEEIKHLGTFLEQAR